MSTENEREDSDRLSPKFASYVSFELAWRHYIGWQEPPTRLMMSNWYNAVDGRWQVVVDVIKQASERTDIADPQRWVWSRLRNYTPARPRQSDTTRASRWIAPEAAGRN
jgi:hypothetical protein